ncbi:MAG: site-2 protease family protein [Actinomycetes bacterium]
MGERRDGEAEPVTWALAIAGIAMLIVIHEAGHAIAAKLCGMRVERFALFFPPLLLKRQIGETEYAIGALPLGGYVRIAGQTPDDVLPPGEEHRSYANRPVWQRAVVIAAGPAANIVAALVIIAAILMLDGVTKVTPEVAPAALSAPAAGALEPGDRIVAVDGVKGGPEVLVRQTRTHSCPGPGKPQPGCLAARPAVLTVERDGRTRTISLYPRWDESVGAMRLGFAFDQAKETLGPLAAASRSVELGWRVSVDTVKGFSAIGSQKGREQLSGIVGVSVVTEQAFSRDLLNALQLLALISLLIAIVNLFPILPLDGGHLFWLAVEKLRGRPASQETLGRATAVGLALVAVLFVIGLSNDIGRLGGSGFPGGP